MCIDMMLGAGFAVTVFRVARAFTRFRTVTMLSAIAMDLDDFLATTNHGQGKDRSEQKTFHGFSFYSNSNTRIRSDVDV